MLIMVSYIGWIIAFVSVLLCRSSHFLIDKVLYGTVCSVLARRWTAGCEMSHHIV